jgi:malonyl-CoA/methylmalonyl-CoA synthetase
MDWSRNITAQNLAELFQDRMGQGSRMFAHCGDGRCFTYAEFWSLAGRLAAKLKSQHAKSGDRIAVQVDKCIEALALFWACARGGFVFLPLNSAYTASEVSYFLGDADPSIFITTPARMFDMASIAGRATVLTLGDNAEGTLLENLPSAFFVDHASTWDDLAAILYTSGTTGRSKGAMLSHGNLASNALASSRLSHPRPVCGEQHHRVVLWADVFSAQLQCR